MTAPVIRLFTFKEGLLSRFGHDLQFAVDKAEMRLEDGRLTGRFWTDSLRVEGAVKRGRVDEGALSAADRSKIAQIATAELLKSMRCPCADLEASVEKSGDDFEIRGSLTLLGQRRALPLGTATVLGDLVVATMSIQPSRWGIRPYRAMAGALRLKDRVDIEIAVEAEANIKKKQTWTLACPLERDAS
jgi:hypothetical protein